LEKTCSDSDEWKRKSSGSPHGDECAQDSDNRQTIQKEESQLVKSQGNIVQYKSQGHLRRIRKYDWILTGSGKTLLKEEEKLKYHKVKLAQSRSMRKKDIRKMVNVQNESNTEK
jgi:hypothetical protein